MAALVAARAELPLQIQRPIRGPAGAAVVTLLTPAGALFDGDTLWLDVQCGPGTDVTLVTTAATKLNRCDTAGIRCQLDVHVAAGAVFRYLPHELIPFRGAAYRQELAISLAADARATLLEVIGPGPTSQPFNYAHLDMRTQAHLADEAIVHEHLVLTQDAERALRGHSHYGSLLAFGPDSGQLAADEAHASLARAGVHGSASVLPAHGIGVKALGSSALELRRALLRSVRVPSWLAELTTA